MDTRVRTSFDVPCKKCGARVRERCWATPCPERGNPHVPFHLRRSLKARVLRAVGAQRP